MSMHKEMKYLKHISLLSTKEILSGKVQEATAPYGEV
jgi:hypothetical protein